MRGAGRKSQKAPTPVVSVKPKWKISDDIHEN